MKAVVTGMIATYPVGGVVWDYAQYALALERLGFEVYYLEDTGWMTYDPRLRRYVIDPSYGVEYLARSLDELSPTLGRRWHFRCTNGDGYGIDRRRLASVVAQAQLFLNVSGGTILRNDYMECARKVLIDTDPGWNHFRNYPRLDQYGDWRGGRGYRSHDHFFTYAERIGRPGCVLPTLGIDWQPTRPPVVLDRWRARGNGTRWTSVLTWKNHPESIEYRGVRYGTKEMEFEKIETLPGLVDAPLEIAAGGTDRPVDEELAKTWYPTKPRWEALGWSVVEAAGVSETPDAYRDYIQGSRGEFSVAKNVYVATRSGWFSCRSVCYLAAGLPVVVQDTGFSEFLPTGAGLLPFSSLTEAAAAIAAVERDYETHREAAREVARTHFDSDRVLGDLLQRCGVAA